MAQLNLLRQRIKAIETIKKITHAMRLISMSMHVRLRQKEKHLEQYKSKFSNLLTTINQFAKNSLNQYKETSPLELEVIILIGSQKGLCGPFNSILFKFFFQDIKNSIQKKRLFISVGKHANDYLKSNNLAPEFSFDTFNSSNFSRIAFQLTEIILNMNPANVIIYSNHSKSFFVQNPKKTQLLPFKVDSNISTDKSNLEYNFEESPEQLFKNIKELYITVVFGELLFKSLLAEQASRFVSMDNSTRNAEKALEKMQLHYNKLRQAAITRELTELTTSL